MIQILKFSANVFWGWCAYTTFVFKQPPTLQNTFVSFWRWGLTSFLPLSFLFFCFILVLSFFLKQKKTNLTLQSIHKLFSLKNPCAKNCMKLKWSLAVLTVFPLLIEIQMRYCFSLPNRCLGCLWKFMFKFYSTLQVFWSYLPESSISFHSYGLCSCLNYS
jgi:hypothetical protein